MNWVEIIQQLNSNQELSSAAKNQILQLRGREYYTWKLFMALVKKPYEKQQRFFLASHVATNLMLPKIKKIVKDINYSTARVHVTEDEIYSDVYALFCDKRCPAFNPYMGFHSLRL